MKSNQKNILLVSLKARWIFGSHIERRHLEVRFHQLSASSFCGCSGVCMEEDEDMNVCSMITGMKETTIDQSISEEGINERG